MRRLQVILVAALAIPLAGCVLSGKPKATPTLPSAPQPTASATPPEPLSIPQTVVELPTPQPFNPDALNTAQQPQPEPAPPTTQAKPPATPPQQQRHTNTQPAGPKPAVEPPAETPPTPEPRPQMTEIVPADEQKRLQGEAQSWRNEAGNLLTVAQRRHLNPNESGMMKNARQWMQQSTDAEKAGDMRSANEYAHKALLLAQEIQRGK